MTSERWQKIEQLYHAALELAEDQRASYLREICANDDALRQEVESLLAESNHAEILETPPIETAANVFARHERESSLVGQPLGSYNVLALIGSGGMGEVYRALDTKLGREVAIKVLPATFLGDPERLARFKREAQMLAALNHPNIAVIHGLEQSGDTHFLVMELIQGETLADRVARGGVLTVTEAVSVCLQVADALEAAHEKRIIHRDLKPANIEVTPEGIVKVLDFGLAKAFEIESAGGEKSSSRTTALGLILGTPAYMSPEQARGKPVDRRTDIWAFGCVLYELLTAKPPFGGETTSDTIASLLEHEPDWQALPRSTPRRIVELLGRCLQKDPRDRLRDIGDARIELAQLRRESSDAIAVERSAPSRRTRSLERFAWLAGVLLLLAILLAVYRPSNQERPTNETIRSEILPPEGAAFGSLALSHDGRQLAFVTTRSGKRQLWVRTMANAAQLPLAGTEGAVHPFWSADNLHIGFFADGKLKRIPASGGAAQVLADAPMGLGGAWNQDGVIVFSPSFNTPLYRVAATGGPSTPLTQLDESDREVSQRWPSFLPGGRRLLYFSVSAQPAVSGPGNTGTLFAGSLDGTIKKRLLVSAYGADYMSGGYVVFARGAALLAQRFNPDTLTLEGQDLTTLSDDMEMGPVLEGPSFTLSASGDVLVYRRRGQPASEQRELRWIARDGSIIGTVGSPDRYWSARVSPDGRFVAAEIEDPDTRANNIWIYDTAKATRTRFTFGRTPDATAVWSPDGRTVVFGSRGIGQRYSLFTKPANGSGPEKTLLQSAGDLFAEDWSQDGRFLLFTEMNPSEKSGAGIWVLPMRENAEPRPLFRSASDDRYPHFSPNGRWVAYRSNESGRNQIYVIPFGEPGGKWQISSDGGDWPAWRPDGQELYFVSPDNELMAAAVRAAGSTFAITDPEVLFKINVLGGHGERFGATADGRRFLALVNKDDAPRPLGAVIHWSAALK
jgi:serine/threonine protein kinase/Tol biopolymer transport system component